MCHLAMKTIGLMKLPKPVFAVPVGVVAAPITQPALLALQASSYREEAVTSVIKLANLAQALQAVLPVYLNSSISTVPV